MYPNNLRRLWAAFSSLASRRVSAYVIALSAASCATATQAAILYGDFSDIPPGVVMYTDVTESSSTDPVPPPRYGAPSITGNNLDFDPTSFGANAANGMPSADITDGQLNFGFMTLPGAGLNSFLIDEGGDFSLLGPGTSATAVIASIIAEVEITHVDGMILPAPLTAQALSSFNADATTSPGANFWSNTLFVDLGPVLASAGFGPDSYATKGEVVINNQLAAFSETSPNTIAFIAKKDFKIVPGGDLTPDVIIPEPASVSLMLFAMLSAAGFRRR